jgi:inner membrane protein
VSPITHFFGSWLVASATANNPRDRTLITLAGVAPDLDGLGILVDVAQSWISGTENTFHYYQYYHHYLLHGWPGAVLICGLLTFFARQHWRVLLMCLVTFHLHLLCDLVGSRGPTPSDLWPICYNEPLFHRPAWFWKYQWRLDGWQNRVITLGLFAAVFWRAEKIGHSCVEVFSQHADKVFVETLRKWRVQLFGRVA